MTRPALLDVNVLVALFDPEHIHHETAHTWFASPTRDQWATCPLTENGLVRVASSPAYPGRRTTFADALDRLTVFCRADDHVFWFDEISLRDTDLIDARSVQGNRRTTDVYLLALAVSNGGRLITFDRSVPTAAVRGIEIEKNLLVLHPDDW